MRAPDAAGATPIKPLGLLCSSRCPGGLVLKLYDLARSLRDAGVPVMGGFQTPMEQEALTFLLRGNQRVVWVPSWHRSIKGLPPDAAKAHADGRLCLHNIFDESARRPSRARGQERNRWIVANCAALVAVHATEDGDTAVAMRDALKAGVPVALVRDPANAELARAMERVVLLDVEQIAAWFRALCDAEPGKSADGERN